MSKHTQVPWTKDLLLDFIAVGCLTDREGKLMTMRIIKGYSREMQAAELDVVPETVDKMLSKIKAKYDNCHKMSPERFPERDC